MTRTAFRGSEGLAVRGLRHRREQLPRESVELATRQWGHGFNNIRRLELIGHIPPGEAEPNDRQKIFKQAETAGST